MYECGDGVMQDYDEALQWYLMAAEQGYGDAQFRLGMMYKEGLGVEEDEAEAVMYLWLGGRQGE